jgi:hypothetical protein
MSKNLTHLPPSGDNTEKTKVRSASMTAAANEAALGACRLDLVPFVGERVARDVAEPACTSLSGDEDQGLFARRIREGPAGPLRLLGDSRPAWSFSSSWNFDPSNLATLGGPARQLDKRLLYVSYGEGFSENTDSP